MRLTGRRLGTVSANEAEERSQLVDEQRGFFEGGEVAAAVQLVPIAQVGVVGFGPPPGGAEYLLREDGTADGHADRLRADAMEALPVEAGRGCSGCGKPIEHHVV